MKKEWFFDCYCGRQFVALLEDDKLTEFSSEKENEGEIVGNIYKGRVMNILTGMNAAFVACGLDKNCYLSMDESYADPSKYEGTMGEMNPTLPDLKVGDEILVQVTKPPRGNKGAKVTTRLSIVGKNFIYLPTTEFVGISRKITDEKTRERVLSVTDRLRDKKAGEGVIIRTQAPLTPPRKLKKEWQFLKKLWQDLLERAKNAPVGQVLHKDLDLPLRVIRDSFGDELVAIHVGNQELYERILKLIRLQKDIPERKLVLYKGERAMYREYGISKIVYDSVRPTVPLDNGGYIVIDQTEAMTVVDVNTGSYVGNKNREQTVFEVNEQAAIEIARQVRLRNIGGLVVVDFIDMLEEEHKEKITEILREKLALDKAKCNVLPMSEFCLTQFTRKRVGNESASFLVKPCQHCKGNGHVHNDFFVFAKIRADILDLFANGFSAAIVELNEGIMRKILAEGVFTGEVKGRWKDKRVYLIPHRTYSEEHVSVRGDNSEILTLPDNAKILY
ncbi:MAG: Rne/Rng family ribonuclease [Clostridia bacterium]|nr:Rne/Rng family ribonuclease [Clostridia bacterium]